MKPQSTANLQKKLGSNKAKIIPSFAYNPPIKPLSRRDKWRLEVKESSNTYGH